MKNLLLWATLLATAPLAARAQSNDGGYQEYKDNIARAAEGNRVAKLNEGADAAARDELARSRAKYNRYDASGNYIYGSHPGDTPFNTYPGLGAPKAKLARWRAYRDSYKASKERGKTNRQEDRADKKAHPGTEAWPGGYRFNKKTGDIIRPDGKVEGNLKDGKAKYTQAPAPTARPARPVAPAAAPRPIDPNNALGKLQEYNREQDEKDRKKAATANQ